MRILLGLLCVVLSLLPIPGYSAEADLEGWNAAKWDMTQRELETAFKGQIAPLEKRERFSKAYVTHGIPEIDIGGFPFKVSFQMSNLSNTLVGVLISPKPSTPSDSEAGFNHLDKMLTLKYGPPAHQVNTREPSERLSRRVTIDGDTNLKRTWVLPKTTISLDYFLVPGAGISILRLHYKPTAKPDDKL
jgi:hypothetical protein